MSEEPTVVSGPWGSGSSGSPLKFMPPGHFCPDVCGLEDFGEADYLRGRVVRGFFWLMRAWPHPGEKMGRTLAQLLERR